MLDHVSIKVKNLKKSKAFYENAFRPLGYEISFGEKNKFWAFDIQNGLFEILQSKSKNAPTPVHIAFRVKDKQKIRAFYKAAIKAGAKDNGAPNPCPEYTPNYYAAFILDPDKNNIEVMLD